MDHSKSRSSDFLEFDLVRRDILSLGSWFAQKYVVVTGAAGFVGRAVCFWLRDLGAAVIGVDCVPEPPDLGDRGVLWFERDLASSSHELLSCVDGADFVVHLAGVASPAKYLKDPFGTIDVAVNGTKSVLDYAAAKKPECVVLASSSEIYGDPEVVPTPEDYVGRLHTMAPRSCYDVSKALLETLGWSYWSYKKVPVVIVRPFNIYGPGLSEFDGRILSRFGSLWKAGKPLEIFGAGDQTRTYCYIDDAVNGILRALVFGRPGVTYNIGNDSPEISVNGLVELLSHLVDNVSWERVGEVPGYGASEPRRRCPDLSRARDELAYVPRVSLEAGLRRFFGFVEATYKGVET